MEYRKYLLNLIPLGLAFLWTGCDLDLNNEKDNLDLMPLSERKMPGEFDYSTKKEIEFKVITRDNYQNNLANVKLKIFSLDEAGIEKELFSGITDKSGIFERTHPVPAASNKIVIKNEYIGLINKVELPLNGNLVEYKFNEYSDTDSKLAQVNHNLPGTINKISSIHNYAFLGTYSVQGKPFYLESPREPITQDFLNDVNASLPENVSVPLNKPDYLAAGNQTNITMAKAGDLYVTFFHEGADKKSVLGFYSFNSENPPVTAADVDSITIIFPNASQPGSGGNLHSGEKVYIGHFPAGTEIGWILLADGWNGDVTGGLWQLYSNAALNQETNPELRQHNLLLHDQARDLTVLGFEDHDREAGSDNDFNDVLFYITSNPTAAINTQNLETITYTGDDTDSDGVNDPVDLYPLNPEKAYNNYYPALNLFGSLAFEDLWPMQGDYDFNDLVVNYYFTEVLNGNNMIVSLEGKFVLMASGARYENGFGFEMGLEPSLVASVTGYVKSGNAVTLSSSGVEAGQDKAVIMVFDNARNVLIPPAGYFANTESAAPYIIPDTLTVTIVFNTPVNPVDAGIPPYNPFIFVNQNRTREVHLPGYSPTTLALGSEYFDTMDDNSTGSGYYKSVNNLPWALDIVEPYEYSLEKVTIDMAHYFFDDWASTSGEIYSDWYKNKAGYRNMENIYAP